MHILTANSPTRYALYNLRRKSRVSGHDFYNAYFTWQTARKFRMTKRYGIAQLDKGRPIVVFRLKSWK